VNFKSQKGFTLIELLVVIAIIGVLASVVLASLNTARSKARDAQRLSDIKQLVNAIEMYYNDNGSYPTCSSGQWDCSSSTIMATLQVTPTYISSISKDPLNISGQYEYYYGLGKQPTGINTFSSPNNNQHYVIAARLENSSNPIFTLFSNTNLNYLKGQ